VVELFCCFVVSVILVVIELGFAVFFCVPFFFIISMFVVFVFFF